MLDLQTLHLPKHVDTTNKLAARLARRELEQVEKEQARACYHFRTSVDWLVDVACEAVYRQSFGE